MVKLVWSVCMRCWSIFAFDKLMLLNVFNFTYFCFFLQTSNDKCWFVSLVRRDHVKNQMGMVSFRSLMNGFSLPRNLMACGKGLFDNFIFSSFWNLLMWKHDVFLCSLIYEPGLKQRLLRYAASALLFTEKGVNPFLVSWNR